MASYSIKDLERLSGIKAHTIRIWEKRYGLIEPERTSTNIRTYCDEELRKILNISILNRNGIKISKIAQLSPDEIKKEINNVVDNNADAQGRIEALILAMVDYNEDRFEKILAKTIIQLGFENTVIKILYPFFSQIGIMWQTGTINVAQEHFISNLVKQKMYIAIDNQIVPSSDDTKTFILFLPEGEWHELGLLFFSYLIKKRGHRVVYLGQSVPVKDLLSVMDMYNYDSMVGSFVASTDEKNAIEYISRISEKAGRKKVYVSGCFFQKLNSDMQNVVKVESPNHFIEILESGNIPA